MTCLLSHLPIIEAIAQFLDLRDLNSFSRVSRKCAICFLRSKKIHALMVNHVKKDPFSFQFVENPTERFTMDCLRMYPWLLKMIKNQTERMCLEIVGLNGYMLEYVVNQTEEICIKAIKKHGFAIFYVKQQTEEIVRITLEQHPCYINYIDQRFLKRRRVR